MNGVLRAIRDESPHELRQCLHQINPYLKWRGQSLNIIIRGRITRLRRIQGLTSERLGILKEMWQIILSAQKKWSGRATRRRFLRKYARYRRRERRIRESIWGKKVFSEKTGRDDIIGPGAEIHDLLHPGFKQWCTI